MTCCTVISRLNKVERETQISKISMQDPFLQFRDRCSAMHYGIKFATCVLQVLFTYCVQQFGKISVT